MPVLIPRALQGLYFLCEPLADGSFGRLYLAIHALTRQHVAIKIIEKSKLGPDSYRVRLEIEALKRLSHPNIYSLYQVIETDGTFYLILEYVPGGELFDYILHNGSLQEPHARILFRQLVSAIGYSHSKGIAHRDLKPENILLKDEQNLRVIDFGLCAKNSDNTYLNTYCGSLAYAAPEVLSKRDYSGPAVDIWSMGVILYTILCGCLPFDPAKPEKLPKLIAKGQYDIDEPLSESARDLISQMLCVNPEMRIKMDELCTHPWVLEDVGHPIELYTNTKSAPSLTPEIVKEISLYTRIPYVEMVRMLRKRSYDYLMATYSIMEHLYEEEDVLMILQRRPIPRPSTDITPHVRPLNTCVESAISADNEDSVRARFHSSDRTTISQRAISKQTIRSRVTQYNTVPTSNASSLMPPPASTPISARTTGPQTPIQIDSGSPKRATISPGRSIDSQLNQLTKDLRLTETDALRRIPSQQFNPTPSKSGEGFAESSENLHNPEQLPNRSYCGVNSSFGSSVSGTDQSKVGDLHTSGGFGSGSSGNPGIFKQFLSRKNTSVGPSAISSNASKLRKIRASNNVIPVRAELSATEVLARISESLRNNSIRFTLKRHGFTCTFASDWGRTLLEFEIEVVNVLGKYTLPKLLLPKKNNSGGGSGNTGGKKTVTPGHQWDTPTALGDAEHVSTTQTPSDDSPSNQSLTLGVKVKRLQGDACTYASICKTVLDHAGVKDGC